MWSCCKNIKHPNQEDILFYTYKHTGNSYPRQKRLIVFDGIDSFNVCEWDGNLSLYAFVALFEKFLINSSLKASDYGY